MGYLRSGYGHLEGHLGTSLRVDLEDHSEGHSEGHSGVILDPFWTLI